MKLIAACLVSSLVSIILLPRLLKGITSLIPSSIRYLKVNLSFKLINNLYKYLSLYLKLL